MASLYHDCTALAIGRGVEYWHGGLLELHFEFYCFAAWIVRGKDGGVGWDHLVLTVLHFHSLPKPQLIISRSQSATAHVIQDSSSEVVCTTVLY